ncbi:MAG: hypothetical protein N2491_09695 [Negativicutes bacterium]|nr:hypothetical protein [Negativicutes bacterium]
MYSPRTDYLTYPAPRESYDANGTALPTSEPSESQIVYTIAESDLPVTTDKAATMKFTALLWGGGKNNGTSAATVSYRILKNGTSIVTGSGSVAAGNYYTVSCYQLYDVKAGDVIEMRLWATAATVDFRYKAMVVLVTRYVPGGKLKQLLASFQYLPSGTGYQCTLAQGINPTRISVGNAYIYTDKNTFNGNHSLSISFSDAYRLATFVCSQDKQFFQLQYGDYWQSTTMMTSSSSLPYYYSACKLNGTIAYTPTGIFIP